MAKKQTRSRRQKKLLDADADVDAMPIHGEHAARAGSEETGSGEASGKGTAVSLPPHLFDGILWYLSALESARFAAVCRSWAGIVSRRLADPAPHLFAFRPTATHRRGEIFAVTLGGEFASSSTGHVGARVVPVHRALQRVTRKTECAGATASGRLVLVSTKRTVLFNPVTGTFRRIKKFPGQPRRACPVPAVVPLGAGGDSFFHAGRNEVGVWRAEDDKWTVRHVGYAESLCMAALCGGAVYALDAEGYTFKIELPSLYATKVAAPSLRDTVLAGSLEKGYLVEAGGEVLFIWPIYTTRRVRGKRDFDPELFDSDGDDGEDDGYSFDDVTVLSGFDVYRLDVEEMQWVMEDRLAGDVALFVSRWSSFSVPASEKGCVGNCIYFVCDEGDGNTWGAFSLAERRMLFENAIGAGSYKERLWFYPSPKEPNQDDLDRRLDEIGYI